MWKMQQKFTNPKGRFYGLYAVLHEIFECSIHFAGIQEMASRADVGLVQARSSVLSVNLMTLPMLVWFANRVGGRYVARATFQIAEKLFDKAFVVTGVLFQISSSLEDPSNQTEIWLLCSPTMLLLCFQRSVHFESHILIGNACRTLEHVERIGIAAAKTLQKFARHRILRESRSTEDISGRCDAEMRQLESR